MKAHQPNEYVVEVFQPDPEALRSYGVEVNGKTLRDALGRTRTFLTSAAAAVAGAKEVDRLKACAP